MMSRNDLSFFTIAAFVVTLAACDGTPRRVFTMNELAGKWRLQPESSRSIKMRMGRVPADSHINLSADGSFTAVDMPLEEVADLKPFRLRSGKGKWKFAFDSDRGLDLDFPDKDGGSLSIEIDAAGTPILVRAIWEPESSERWIWRKARD